MRNTDVDGRRSYARALAVPSTRLETDEELRVWWADKLPSEQAILIRAWEDAIALLDGAAREELRTDLQELVAGRPERLIRKEIELEAAAERRWRRSSRPDASPAPSF